MSSADDLAAPVSMDADSAQATAFGAAVRHARRHQGWTLQALADRSGVSRAMLSKVERGEKNPTIRIAKLIARALDTSLSTLFGSRASDTKLQIIRGPSRTIFRDEETGFVREVLIPEDGSGTEWVRHTLPPTMSTDRLPAQPISTHKRVLVEAGIVAVALGAERHVLAAGDAMSFAADVEHEFANAGDVACRYILAITQVL